MFDTLIKTHVDDYKAISVSTYRAMRKKHFAYLEEDLSFLDGYETLVVLALSFPKEEPPYKGKGFGKISRYAHGVDYHIVFRDKLRIITGALASQGYRVWADADISPVDERFAAFLSGMGFLGHNRFLIHPDFGTHLYLATMLVDAPLHTTPYAEDSCGTCRKCIAACPTDALEVNAFHRERCLSHTTQEKIPLSLEEIAPIKQYVFGCDICQNVCPKNRAISPMHHPQFKSDEAAQLHLTTLLEMSNKQLMKRYRNYAFAWRGMSVLKRNAVCIMFNQKHPRVFEYARTLQRDYAKTPWLHQTLQTILNEE